MIIWTIIHHPAFIHRYRHLKSPKSSRAPHLLTKQIILCLVRPLFWPNKTHIYVPGHTLMAASALFAFTGWTFAGTIVLKSFKIIKSPVLHLQHPVWGVVKIWFSKLNSHTTVRYRLFSSSTESDLEEEMLKMMKSGWWIMLVTPSSDQLCPKAEKVSKSR